MATEHVQMGGEPLIPDPTQPPPRPHLPAGRSFGLDPLKPYFDIGTWETFIAVVAWTVHWQDVSDKRVPNFDLSLLGQIMSPFIGMGNPNVWPIYHKVVSTLFMTTMLQWAEEGEEYRANNSLVWAVVDRLGPDLAQLSMGWDARRAVKDLIRLRKLEVTFR